MAIVNVEPNSPVTDFKTKFEYAWRMEEKKPFLSVEHYVVNWTIENLKLLICNDNLFVSSSTFNLDASKTSWYIKIFSKDLSNKEGNLVLYLYRSDDTGGPRSVGLTFQFGISELNGSIMWLDEIKIPEFHKGFCCNIPVISNEKNPFSESFLECKRGFVVTCDMYITFEIPRCDEDLLTAADYDLINFSFDFSKLMVAKESTDYSVIMSNRTSFRAHKVILAARSKVFEEILKTSDHQTSVTFDDVTSENMIGLFNFIYSGNLSKAVQDPPSIGFYECAEKFAISELSAILAPKRFLMRTTLRNMEIHFTWSIKNFSKLPIDNDGMCRVMSPEFSLSAQNSPKWVLMLSLLKSADHLAIYAETDGVTKALRSVLKISLVNRNNELINTQITTEFRKPKQTFGFINFMSRFSVHDKTHGLVVDDTVRVFCEIQFVTSVDIIEAHDLHAYGPITFLDSYRKLSHDISKLLDNPELSDVSLKTCDCSVIKVHKSVLFARSRKFYSKFLYYNKDEDILDVLDVHPDIVVSMIRHAYSGVLNPMPTEGMLKLHQAAEAYVFRQLILVTLYHLASQINIENFFLLYSEARNPQLPNHFLQSRCEAFALENSKQILETADWEEWRRQNNELCNILTDLLSLPSPAV